MFRFGVLSIVCAFPFSSYRRVSRTVCLKFVELNGVKNFSKLVADKICSCVVRVNVKLTFNILHKNKYIVVLFFNLL